MHATLTVLQAKPSIHQTHNKLFREFIVMKSGVYAQPEVLCIAIDRFAYPSILQHMLAAITRRGSSICL